MSSSEMFNSADISKRELSFSTSSKQVWSELVSGLLTEDLEKQSVVMFWIVLRRIKACLFLSKGLYFEKEKALLKYSCFPDNINIIQLSADAFCW